MHRHLNNNTPVNTEVLLLARTPGADHDQQVLDVDDTIAVCVTHA
jgi:hypothetical protein